VKELYNIQVILCTSLGVYKQVLEKLELDDIRHGTERGCPLSGLDLRHFDWLLQGIVRLLVIIGASTYVLNLALSVQERREAVHSSKSNIRVSVHRHLI
jgi:hypothetical protein